MNNLWNDTEAAQYEAAEGELGLRVYTSRLLGRDDSLVLHGGGNTSMKGSSTNIFGDEVPTLFIKGSGWDLKTIESPGLPATNLETLQRLATLQTMTDTEMARELKLALLDPASPSPSVEAILHAIIPLRFVDHTHADAVVTISNSPQGRQRLQQLYGDEVLILPYIMPGFILARQVYEATQGIDWSTLKGIVLEHHGIFSFADDARSSYDNMIAMVAQAEDYLISQGAADQLLRRDVEITAQDGLNLAAVRKQVCDLAGRAMLARLNSGPEAAGYASRPDVAAIATRGPVTPDHSLHTKRIPAVLADSPVSAVKQFGDDYRAYFDRHNNGSLTCLDPAPRVAVWLERGVLAFAPNAKRMAIVADIADHTRSCVQSAEALGGWEALPERDIFELEYWELEQVKLKKAAAPGAFEGRVALVSGAASGIGLACVEALVADGAAVIGLDINPAVAELSDTAVLGIQCDITDGEETAAALQQGLQHFGGLDILVSNAGIFPSSRPVAELDEDDLETSLQLNFQSHARLLKLATPYLALGINPAVVLMASKNVPAPGPGALAYSSAKAALTQLGRIAALELGEQGIRVNMLHPNAVYDTALWTEETLQARADSYGLSVEQYKTNNALGLEVRSCDVASAVLALAGSDFPATTGAQIPVDGGNERVI